MSILWEKDTLSRGTEAEQVGAETPLLLTLPRVWIPQGGRRAKNAQSLEKPFKEPDMGVCFGIPIPQPQNLILSSL